MNDQTIGDARKAHLARRADGDGGYHYAARVDPEDPGEEWRSDEVDWYSDAEIADDWEIVRAVEDSSPRDLLQAAWDAACPLPDGWTFQENRYEELIYKSTGGKFSVGVGASGLILDRSQYRLLDKPTPPEVTRLAEDLRTLMGFTPDNPTEIARSLVERGYTQKENA